MNTSRRSFIKQSAIAVAGFGLAPQTLLKEKQENILGLQLYTVREDMAKDPAGTLKKIAGMGYHYVEHAGYQDRKFYGYSIADFKKLLHHTGLQMDSGHSFLGVKHWNTSANDFTDEWKYTVGDAATAGMKYLISPGVEESLCKNMDGFKHYIDMLNKTGELCKQAGIRFGFHNENYEFNHHLNGSPIYDLLLQLTDKNLVAQQIDMGNMYEPGGRAMHYLKKYPGRFNLIHVKDEIKKERHAPDENLYQSTLLGKGVVGVKEIVDYARKTGTEYFIIEQEDYQDSSPLTCSDYDLKMMKGWGF